MSRAIITSMHCYTPWGRDYYQPIEDYFIGNLTKYKDEFDHLYILDSQWGFEPLPEWITVIKTNPSVRYYDAYKQVLPDIKEEEVLFLDNDFVIYKPGVISMIFGWLKEYGVASIFDTIGDFKTDKMNGKNKLCPYFFASSKKLLMNYLDVDWGNHMPHSETLGLLTEEMLKDNIKLWEMQEDKSNFLFGETLGSRRSKNFGYYHVRSGSTPAYLLSHRQRGDRQYTDYLKNQPKSEYLRQMAWYQIMGGDVDSLIGDLVIGINEWSEYIKNFKIFHGL